MLILLILISTFFMEHGLSGFELAFLLVVWFVGFLFVGLVAAVIGSELASLSMWLRARKKKQR